MVPGVREEHQRNGIVCRSSEERHYVVVLVTQTLRVDPLLVYGSVERAVAESVEETPEGKTFRPPSRVILMVNLHNLGFETPDNVRRISEDPGQHERSPRCSQGVLDILYRDESLASNVVQDVPVGTHAA
jgi:hypothetical protein